MLDACLVALCLSLISQAYPETCLHYNHLSKRAIGILSILTEKPIRKPWLPARWASEHDPAKIPHSFPPILQPHLTDEALQQQFISPKWNET